MCVCLCVTVSGTALTRVGAGGGGVDGAAPLEARLHHGGAAGGCGDRGVDVGGGEVVMEVVMVVEVRW